MCRNSGTVTFRSSMEHSHHLSLHRPRKNPFPISCGLGQSSADSPVTWVSAPENWVWHLFLARVSVSCLFFIIRLFLAVLGPHCCVGFSLVAARKGHSVVGASHCDWLGARASGAAAVRSACSSQVSEHRFRSCSTQA